MFEARLENFHFTAQKIKIDKETIELPELMPEYINLCGRVLEINDRDEHVASKPRKITVK
jgi:hypothetical protein